MRALNRVVLAAVFLCVTWVAAAAEKPADLPDSYRDFAIYATSRPQPPSDGTILVTVQLVNRGNRPLPTRVALHANPNLGFDGDEFQLHLDPGRTEAREFGMRPPDGLVREIITGDIHFGETRARELFIAVQGPDPDGWQPDRQPDVDDKNETLKITARAQVVATYAPSVRTDWWPHHPSSTLAPDQRVQPLITLASKGATDYVVMMALPPDGERGDEGLQQAIGDLVHCLNVMSGATLEVVDSYREGVRAILLRQNNARQWPHPDAHHLFTTKEGDVVIEAGAVDGLRNGIYSLLTDYLDCHWFLPGGLGEEVPRPADRSAVIGQIDQERQPSFFSAIGACWGQGLWNIRCRGVANRHPMSFGHAWAGLLKGTPELYEQHPEWWARDRDGKIRMFDQPGGWSFTNFCTTNPDVLDIVARKLNEQLSAPGAIVASIDPNDLAPFCLCENCRAVDGLYGADNPDGSFSSDRMIHFANEMHRRLSPENQNKYLGFLVYGHQIQLPVKARPVEQIAGIICNMDWSYDHTRPINDFTAPSNRKFYRLVKGWGEILSQFGYYDYPTDYVHYGPYGQVMKLREDLPLVREMGVTFTFVEGQPILGTSALNLYICNRLQYDVNEDADVLMEEFFQKYHGPAAEPMRKFWLRAELYTATLRPGPRAQNRMTRNQDMWCELGGYLKEAEAIVANLPQQDKRFADRVAYHRNGFELGRRKCQIRDTLYDPEGNLRREALIPDSRRMIEQYIEWIAARRAECDNSDGYLPPFLPGYYYAELDEFIQKALKESDEDRMPSGS